MKKTFSIVSILLLGVTAFAADLAQLTLSISTPGPDAYADGTPVQVGETYLLVYVSPSATFQGVRSDGSLVNPVENRVATEAYAVEGAKCGFKAIQYPADLFPAGGSWVIVLLDTRDASGVVGGLVAAQGASASTDETPGGATTLRTLGAAATGGGAAPILTASTQSSAPANVTAPAIAAIEPQGETVNVRIKDFAEGALYEVQTTTDLAAGSWQPAANGTRVQGCAANAVLSAGGTPELPVAVQVPANDKVRFFRVIVPGSN